MGLIGLFTSISDAFRKDDAPTNVLCPFCEEPVIGKDHGDCARKRMSRRFFFGLAGASAAALALRIEGVPIPTARIQVIARTRDLFEVEGATGLFAVVFEDAKDKDSGKPYWDETGLAAGGLLTFDAHNANKVRVNSLVDEMRIPRVVDHQTQKPLKYRIIRAQEADARKIRAAEERERERIRKAEALRIPPSGVPYGTFPEAGWPREGDFEWRDGFVKIDGPRDRQWFHRARPEYEFRYSLVTGKHMITCKSCGTFQMDPKPMHAEKCQTHLVEKYPKNTSLVRFVRGLKMQGPVGALPA